MRLIGSSPCWTILYFELVNTKNMNFTTMKIISQSAEL